MISRMLFLSCSCWFHWTVAVILTQYINICDVIKQNGLELANTVFKIQPNKADSFFCFWLFVQSFNCLYLWNQLSNLCGIFTKLKPKEYPNRKCQKKKKKKNNIFRLQIHFVWSHHKCGHRIPLLPVFLCWGNTQIFFFFLMYKSLLKGYIVNNREFAIYMLYAIKKRKLY